MEEILFHHWQLLAKLIQEHSYNCQIYYLMVKRPKLYKECICIFSFFKMLVMKCTLFLTQDRLTATKVDSTYLGCLTSNTQHICLWQDSNA